MNLLKPACSIAAAVVLATAGAPAMAQEKTETSRIRVYDAGELALERYTVVKRIWTGTWHAALWMPEHADLADGIDDLKAKAADVGADGLVNVHCLSDADRDGSYFCYGLAIKLK